METRRASRLNANQTTNRKASLATSLILLAILWAAVFALPVVAAQTNPPPSGFRTDRILVKPNPGADLTTLHAELGTTVYRSYSVISNLQTVQLPQGASVSNMLVRFQQSDLVQYAEPDYIVHALNEPNDSHYVFGDLWNFKNVALYGGTAGADIHAPAAWDM